MRIRLKKRKICGGKEEEICFLVAFVFHVSNVSVVFLLLPQVFPKQDSDDRWYRRRILVLHCIHHTST